MLRKISMILMVSSQMLALACTGPAGPSGAEGEQGAAGEPCTVTSSAGTHTVTCGDQTVTLSDGQDGTDGDSCNSVSNEGTTTITCTDAFNNIISTTTVADGASGTAGHDGVDGDSCGAVDNGDGTFTITCTDADNNVISTSTITDPGYVPPAYLSADVTKGGAAYSKWWISQADGAGALSDYDVTVGTDFVRCKACHGWDGLGNKGSYANRTGTSTGSSSRPDVSAVNLHDSAARLTPTQLFNKVKGAGGRPGNEKTSGHPDFSALLSDQQAWNLVKFLREGLIEPSSLYELTVDGEPVHVDAYGMLQSPSLSYNSVGAMGDPINGATVFANKCAACHGANGAAVTNAPGGSKSVGQFVRSKPNEAWFKAMYGEVGNDSTPKMLPGILTSFSDVADLYAALSNPVNYPSLDSSAEPSDYASANGIKGGVVYAKWYVTEAGGNGSAGDYGITAPTDFVRCKACHAWDGLGNAASYANRTGQSTGSANRPDVAALNLRAVIDSSSKQLLFDKIMASGTGRHINTQDSSHPDFASSISASQAWDLVKFMKEEWINPADLYSVSVAGEPLGPDNEVAPVVSYFNIGWAGDAAAGDIVYQAKCAACHGNDGLTQPPGGTKSVGQFVREKPNEAWFKAKFGEPGKMTSGIITDTQDMQDLYKAMTDTTKYPDYQ